MPSMCRLARELERAAGGVSISSWRPGHRRAGPAWRLTAGEASADLREITQRVIDARP
jgi:hypothetical protein